VTVVADDVGASKPAIDVHDDVLGILLRAKP
jgi:hypothetical protein